MATRNLTIRYIATRSKDGQELCRDFVEKAQAQGHQITCPEASPAETMRTLFSKDDLVIVDATREEKSSEHNYHMITQAFSVQPHVILVSRNPLPLNISCQRDAIADDNAKKVYQNAPPYRGTLSNKELLHFLGLQMQYAAMLPPRKAFGSVRDMVGGILKKSFGKYDLDEQGDRRHQTGQIFISFRSHDSDKVAKLKEYLAREDNKLRPGGKSVRFFPTGTVSNEMFTEWRRWNVLSWLDRFIGPADELWIYKSKKEDGNKKEGECDKKDKNYFNSWWTLGELMTVGHRRSSGGFNGKKDWRVCVFEEGDGEGKAKESPGKLIEVGDGFFPAMSEEQHRRLARWYANTDAMQMGIESLARSAKLAQMPFVPAVMERYVTDHVFSPEFWTEYLLDCPHCRNLGENENRFDVDTILWHRAPNFTRFTQEAMQEAMAGTKRIRCGNPKCPCPSPYFTVEEDKESHYLHLIQILKDEDIETLRTYFEDTSGDRYLLKLPNYIAKPISSSQNETAQEETN